MWSPNPHLMQDVVAIGNADGECHYVAVKKISKQFFYSAISSLGEELRFEIVKPILEQCDAATLYRIEDANPVGGPKVLIRALGAYAVQSHFELEVEPKVNTSSSGLILPLSL